MTTPTETRREGDELRVYVQVPGVVVPAWLAIVFASALIFSVVGFILSLLIVQDKSEALKELSREIRVLQLHTQDVESVLIQQGLANRDDFAEWGDAPQRTRPPARESEE